MTVVSATPDTERLQLTVVAELAAPPERAWLLWTDPRQLERWWGPPTWPATFVSHDPRPGGRSAYYMTGPDGEQPRGWWEFDALDEPRSLEMHDGFAHDDGTPDDSMPVTRTQVRLEPHGDGSRMTVVSTFASAEQMQQLLDMGMVEGMTGAMGQMDAVLAGA